MASLFDPDTYFSRGEWRDAIDPSKNLYERIGLNYEDNPSHHNIKTAFQKRYDWWREVNKRYNANPANTKTKDTGPVSKEAMEKLHNAYTILSDPAKKAAYERQLKDDEGKQAHMEFLRMVNIVISEGVLTEEGKKILFNCANTLNIGKTRALEIISLEMKRTGATFKADIPATVQETIPNYYTLLDISQTATHAEIEAAYTKHCLVWSSLGSNPRFRDNAQQKLKVLQEAFSTLADRNKRRDYDLQLLRPFEVPKPKTTRNKSILVPVSIIGIAALSTVFIITVLTKQQKTITYVPSLPPESKQNKNTADTDTPVAKSSSGHGWLGVVIQDLDRDLAKAFNVTGDEGVLVSEIPDNSPAQEAGLEPGDIMLVCDGDPIRNVDHFLYTISQKAAGETVNIMILRNGEEQEIEAVVGEKPPELPVQDTAVIPYENELGLTVQDITKEIAKSLGIRETQGVIVSEVKPESRAANAGLKKGDLINEINRKEIINVADFKATLSKLDIEKAFRVHVKRGSFFVYLIIKEKKL